jgi:hypothetical protein
VLRTVRYGKSKWPRPKLETRDREPLGNAASWPQCLKIVHAGVDVTLTNKHTHIIVAI